MNCSKFRRYTAARRKEIPGMVIETLKHTESEEKLLNRQVADVSAAHSHGCITHFYALERPKQYESEQVNAQAKVTPSQFRHMEGLLHLYQDFGLRCFPF
jgi:hypothetical protein